MKKCFKENKQTVSLTTDIWVAQVTPKDFSLNDFVPYVFGLILMCLFFLTCASYMVVTPITVMCVGD